MSTELSTAPAGVEGDAVALLAQTEAQFWRIAAALARACGGPQREDAWQGAVYEMAWALADLRAAQHAVGQAGVLSAIQRQLAEAFAVEAVPDVLARLQRVAADLGLDAAPLMALAASGGLSALRQRATLSAQLGRLGASVLDDMSVLDIVAPEADVAMAREAFGRFAREVVEPLAQDIHRQDLTVPETLLAPLREMGVFGLSIPQAFGGSASGEAHDDALMIAVTEVLSEASLAAAGSLITRPEILSRALLLGGTKTQKETWLPRIATGELLCAIAITEPDHGSDVAGLRLSAIRTDGGWRLHGAKSWCTFAGRADLLMVVARTDPRPALGHRGLSLFLVRKQATEAHSFECTSDGGGRLIGHATPTLGYRGMHSYELSFDGFFVPDDHLIGGEPGLGKGFYFTMAGMTGGRLQTAGRACGVMRAALRAAVNYARDRHVFGAALADFQLTQIRIARMAARYLACRRLAEGAARDSDPAALPINASLAKLIACRSAEWVTRDAQQLHGAMGYAEETPVSRLFVDARVLSIFEGAEETLALKVIGRSLLECARAAEVME